MANLQNLNRPSWFYKLNFCFCWVHICLTYLFFNNKILKILFKIIVKIFNPFVLKIYLFIVSYNDFTIKCIIVFGVRPVFCIGAIVKPNWNKLCKKNQKNPEFFCRYQHLKYGRSTVIDRRNSVCDRRKASFNDYNDHQCLDVTKTLNDFDSFATTS